jgi:centromere protein I
VIPEVHTFRANEVIIPAPFRLYSYTHVEQQTSVTLEEIDNVEDFVGKLERIEPPGQMVSFLTDPLLQKFVDLNPSPIIVRRIDLWLSTCLEEEYEAISSGAETSAYLEELLDGLYRHTQYTNVSRSTLPR